MPIQIYETSFTIAGHNIPAFRGKVSIGSYGQLGTAEVHTSLAALKAQKIDFPALSSANNLPVNVSLNGKRIFGGTYMYGYYTPHNDEAHLVCRDYAGALFDSKRSIAELNIQNQHVSDLVQQICQQFGDGLTAQINIQNDPLVGTILNDGAVSVTYPQSMWQLLNFLARQVGASIYTTEDQILVFESQIAGAANTVYTWRARPDQLGLFLGPATGTNSARPIKDLEFLHQPARNRNFSVVVVSHHQQTCVQTVSTVTVAGQNIQNVAPKSIPAGYYSGQFGKTLSNILNTKGNGIPIYLFNESGLTPAQCQDRAQSIAQNIARRLLVVTLLVDGNQDIKPLQQIQIGEAIQGDLLGFADQALYISGVDHHFDMPQGEDLSEAGFWTTIKALTVPPVANPLSNNDVGELTGAL